MAYSKNSFLRQAKNKSFYTGLNYDNLPKIPATIRTNRNARAVLFLSTKNSII